MPLSKANCQIKRVTFCINRPMQLFVQIIFWSAIPPGALFRRFDFVPSHLMDLKFGVWFWLRRCAYVFHAVAIGASESHVSHMSFTWHSKRDGSWCVRQCDAHHYRIFSPVGILPWRLVMVQECVFNPLNSNENGSNNEKQNGYLFSCCQQPIKFIVSCNLHQHTTKKRAGNKKQQQRPEVIDE